MSLYTAIESEMQAQPDYGEDTYRGRGRLEGRSAIITGEDSGIGCAVALALRRAEPKAPRRGRQPE